MEKKTITEKKKANNKLPNKERVKRSVAKFEQYLDLWTQLKVDPELRQVQIDAYNKMTKPEKHNYNMYIYSKLSKETLKQQKGLWPQEWLDRYKTKGKKTEDGLEPIDSIAECLGMSINTVRTTLACALGKLKELIEVDDEQVYKKKKR